MTDKSRKAVSREPTETMLDAGAACDLASRASGYANEHEALWKAMFDAAPVLATAPADDALQALSDFGQLQTAEPPKDGEVARTIDELRDISADEQDTYWIKHAADLLESLAAEVAALLARPTLK